jgi:K+-transporting ATPase A subunit
MSTTTAGVLFALSLVVALVAVHRPFGDHLYRVVSGTRSGRVERGIYRLVGVDPAAEQSWGGYARSVLAFLAVSVLFLYAFQRLQHHLPLSLGRDPVAPPGAWNTAVSFVTNTNWQWYSGESTTGHLVQMAGLTVQNFVSAAVGIAVGQPRQGHAIAGAMAVVALASVALTTVFELGGMMTLGNMMLGEVVPGGVGSGLCGLPADAVTASGSGLDPHISRTSRWPGWRGSAARTRRRSAGWSRRTPPAGRSASWASRL